MTASTATAATRSWRMSSGGGGGGGGGGGFLPNKPITAGANESIAYRESS